MFKSLHLTQKKSLQPKCLLSTVYSLLGVLTQTFQCSLELRGKLEIPVFHTAANGHKGCPWCKVSFYPQESSVMFQEAEGIRFSWVQLSENHPESG